LGRERGAGENVNYLDEGLNKEGTKNITSPGEIQLEIGRIPYRLGDFGKKGEKSGGGGGDGIT